MTTTIYLDLETDTVGPKSAFTMQASAIISLTTLGSEGKPLPGWSCSRFGGCQARLVPCVRPHGHVDDT